MKNKLIRLADYLDRNNNKKLANKIDKMIVLASPSENAPEPWERYPEDQSGSWINTSGFSQEVIDILEGIRSGKKDSVAEISNLDSVEDLISMQDALYFYKLDSQETTNAIKNGFQKLRLSENIQSDLPKEIVDAIKKHMHGKQLKVLDIVTNTDNPQDQRQGQFHRVGPFDDLYLDDPIEFYIVTALPVDPSELPLVQDWHMWIESPEDENFGLGTPIENSENRIYGEY